MFADIFIKKNLKYPLLFTLTGIVVILYAFFVAAYFENVDIGKRFQAGEFRESDLYIWIGIIWIAFGLFYATFHFIDKIQLAEKKIYRHYWYTFFFLIQIMAVPILDKYYPTNEHDGELFMSILDLYLMFPGVLFVMGIYNFVVNLFMSTYAYIVIKRKWED